MTHLILLYPYDSSSLHGQVLIKRDQLFLIFGANWEEGASQCGQYQRKGPWWHTEVGWVVRQGLRVDKYFHTQCGKWSHLFMSSFLWPLDYRVHGVLQARILEWVAVPFSRGSSQPRDQTQVSRIAGRFFTSWATREAHVEWGKGKWPGKGAPQQCSLGNGFCFYFFNINNFIVFN